MIVLNDCMLEWSGMGLFTSDEPWIHPTRTERTWEIICVISGTVHLEESGKEYILEPGDLILLEANRMHRGSRESRGTTSFYWLHFKMDQPPDWLPRLVHSFTNTSLLRELLHYGTVPNADPLWAEAILAHLLVSLSTSQAEEESTPSKAAAEIFEWTRVNADAALTVSEAAAHFGYCPEHITRMMKKNYGVSLKAIINDFILQKAKALLGNTNQSVKTIALALAFRDANAFVNFYKYHEKTTPTKYRNGLFSTHMNKR